MITIGLIGFGYWGPNLLRNLLGNPMFQVVAVSDINQDNLNKVKLLDSRINISLHPEELIHDLSIDAVVIATPVMTHFSLAAQALKKKKHVLIEKPMSSTKDECLELIRLAQQANVTLMVDHTFIWNGAVQKIDELCKKGELGKICYFDSTRINLGLFQQDINVLWDLGPHDFSILNLILKESPIHMEATGYSHVNLDKPDIVYLTMHFASDIIAHVTMSWMSPVKVRRLAIGGTDKMLVWDDLNPEEKIKIYNNGITYQKEDAKNTIIPEYRIGDMYSPRVSNDEALKKVVAHFARVITNQEKSLMDGAEGLKVVSMLEDAQKALDRSLSEVNKKRKEMPCKTVCL